MDIFKFNYSHEATRWEICIRMDGDKNCNDKSRAWVDVTQCQSKTGCKTWRVYDEQLVRHMGCAMYLAFYRVVKYNKEPIQYYDFDEEVLKYIRESGNISAEEVEEIEEKIRHYKTNDYLDLWREVKATLAAAIVIISSFDWVHYQKESCKLTNHSNSMIEYLIYTLTFITKRHQSTSIFAQDILNYLQRQRCLYPDDVKVKICLGVESIASSSTIEDECTLEKALSTDESWWEFFWVAVILLIIIFLLMWWLTSAAERRGHNIRKTYGEPLSINILPTPGEFV